MTGRNLLVPENLNVKGRGISPTPAAAATTNGSATAPSTPTSPHHPVTQPFSSSDLDASMPSSTRTSVSEDGEGETGSEEYTVLDGVREMNHILVRQIETLRLKIKVDEKNYDQDKAKLAANKDSEIREKESEIEDLKESLTSRDEHIHTLSRAGEEKDRTIRSKSVEIEELKKIVQQTEEYATKLQNQVGRVQSERDRLESDSLYKEQNEEIKKLTEELELLRGRLGTMEQELQRAMTVIQQQNEKMKQMDAERTDMQQKFREDLDRASKAMRQEVERMREVMRQNYEEMRNLREQNREMANDVRAIKDMLRRSRANAHVASNTTTELHHYDSGSGHVTGLARPLATNPTHSPSYAKQTNGLTSNVAPKGPGKMVGGNIAHKASFGGHQPHPPPARENSTSGSNGLRISGPRQHQREDGSPSRLSPDTSARTISKGQTPRISSFSQQGGQQQLNLNVPVQNGIVKPAVALSQKNLPPIASIKEVSTPLTRQPSGRAGRGVVRKGSAVRKQ